MTLATVIGNVLRDDFLFTTTVTGALRVALTKEFDWAPLGKALAENDATMTLDGTIATFKEAAEEVAGAEIEGLRSVERAGPLEIVTFLNPICTGSTLTRSSQSATSCR